MSRIDLTLKEMRRFVYYSDVKGVSEFDLSKYIGNDDGQDSESCLIILLTWGANRCGYAFQEN